MRYLDLLNVKCKWHWKVIWLFCLFAFFVSFVLSRDIQDVYNTFGYVKNGNIVFNLDLDHVNILDKIDCLKVNGVISEAKVLNVGELMIDEKNLINYQDVILDSSNNYVENQVVKLNIYHNKEKVWRKLKKIIWR